MLAERPLPWRLERGVSLGGEEAGPQSFFRVAAGLVASDDRSRIYVLDPQQRSVVVFERDGTYVRSLGSEGEGPGELSSPRSISVEPDGTVSVFDFGKAALVRFSPEGVALRQVPLPYLPWPDAGRHFEATSRGILVASMLPSRADGQFRHALSLLGPADTVVVAERSFPRPGMARYPSCAGGLNLPAIFEMHVTWAANGTSTVTAAGPAYDITVLEGTRPIRRVRASVPLRPATRALAVAELGEGFTVDFGRGACTIPAPEMVDSRGFAEFVPWIDELTVAPSGETWVRRRGVGREIGAAIDVFDATGGYLGTLPGDGPFPVVFLDVNTFGAPETDAFDITRLVLYRIDR